ncbi:MAG: DUF1667 domain-containing protein [Eubacterium sp.]|nr:DUF1667 domain-containing protein [Eubacterium sp.]
MEKINYTCIVCPKSCKGELAVGDDGSLEATGFDCNNGKKYAVNEYTDPKRMLTTTVKVKGGIFNLLPVVSGDEISKSKLMDCIHSLYTIEAKAPVKAGDVVVCNILDTGVDIIAARDIKAK